MKPTMDVETEGRSPLLPEMPKRTPLAAVRSVMGYAWAVLAFFIVVGTFLGNNILGGKLAHGTGIKVSPRFTGGEVVATIEHGGYRTLIHRPVFDGLFAPRREGFIQVNWESARALPAVIQEPVTVAPDRSQWFTIRLDTATGTAAITSGGASVVGVEKSIRMKNGWAVRVLLRKG
jgi:hypothetical protein